MTDIADRYRRLSATFAERIANVPAGAWDDPTPCPDWTVRDLVGHVVQSQGMFRTFVGREAPDVDVTADPAAAFDTVRTLVQGDLDDPERAGSTFEGHFGTQTFEQAVDRFLVFDLVVHGWDLARATGQDEALDPDEVAGMLAGMEPMDEAIRGSGQFGPRVPVPDDADTQTKLIAFTGRQP